MDISKLLHDEIIAHRDLQIGQPELLAWTQDRIDALYAIKQTMDHQFIASPEGQHFNLPRVKNG